MTKTENITVGSRLNVRWSRRRTCSRSIGRRVLRTDCRVVRLVVCCLIALLGGSLAEAQTALQNPAAAESSGTGNELPDASGRLTDPPKANEHVIFVDEHGEVVRITAGGQIGDYLKWREQLLRGSKDDQPGYYVAAITLSGQVSATRTAARLDASIEIFVREDVDQVVVPLRLNQATLLAHRNAAPGAVEFLPTDRGAGMTCRISEPGQHRIDLQLSVPVRKSGSSYRLQLSLPGTAQSSLRLAVPGEVLAVRPDQLADVEVRKLPNAQSELIVHGLGAALDLPWQVVSTKPEEKTELQVETLMSVEAGADGLAIEAVQTVTATVGSFESINIEIPQGFDVLSVSSSTHESIRTSDVQISPIRVSVPEGTAGPLRLRWLLSSPAPNTGENRFSIGEFSVADSSRQETLIGISVAEGFRLSQLTPRPQQLLRIPTALFRQRVEQQFEGPVIVQQAYRLAGRNTRVQFQLEPIEASFRVSPEYDLLFRESTAEMSARFEIIVYRGSLDSVPLRWPRLVPEEWEQIEVVEPAEQVHLSGIASDSSRLPTRAARDGEGADALRLEFVEPLNRTHGAVTVEIRARRPVQVGEEAFLISIPTAESDSIPVSQLQVRNASNVESTIDAAGDTTIRFVSSGLVEESSGSKTLPPNLVPRILECTSPELTFRATVTTHAQQVTTSSRAMLNVSDEQIVIQQRLRYSVAYRELDRLRILVPGNVQPNEFRLVSSDGKSSTPLTAEVGGLEIDGVRQIRVNLPKPMLGQFDVVCTYSMPMDESLSTAGFAETEVPLLQPPEIQGDATRVEVRSPGNVGIQLTGQQWTQELTLSDAPSWVTPGTVRSVRLKIQAAPDRATQNFVVRRSALRTRFQSEAATRTTGVYLIDGDISFLTVTLPSDADRSSLRAWWDGQRLGAETLQFTTLSDLSVGGERADSPQQPDRLRIVVDDLPRRNQHVLTLEYDTVRAGEFDVFSELSMRVPQFASDVWLADTVWELILPIDQHLFVYPENYTPAFSWQRQAVMWSRRPIDAGARMNDWLSADVDAEMEAVIDSQLKELRFDPFGRVSYGNSYLFSAFGHQHDIQFRAMSQPAILLVGAGLALAVGLVLLRIPTTRHVLTILVVGFGLSLAGLWHLEAVQLLLQPAVFGLVLAVVASIIESRVKRRQRASLVTFSSPSDFLVTGSSREAVIHDESDELSERPA